MASALAIPAEVLDRAPETQAEHTARIHLVSTQTRAALGGESVRCPCGAMLRPPYLAGYRCWFCLVVFCRECGRRHFCDGGANHEHTPGESAGAGRRR